MDERPIIFGYGASTYTRMVRIAADEKGVDYFFQTVASWDGYEKDAGYSGLHPFRKVPVFEHRGAKITETIAILSYLDSAFEGPPLRPTDPLEIARMWEIISITISYAWPIWVPILATHRLFNPMAGDPTDEALIANCLPEMRHAAKMLGAHAAERGETFDLADIVLAGALKYATETPEGADILGASPALSEWWARICNRPAVVTHMPDTDWAARAAEMANR